MSGKVHHILDAKDLDATREEGDYALFRTVGWQIVEAPDDPSVLAILAKTMAGPIVGLEFPKSEAKELARQLAALTSPSLGGKH